MEGLRSGLFITFSGNCRKALTFYQTCFGGSLHFEFFDEMAGSNQEVPVVSASLVSQRILIYGSDLVHDEGRKTGNCVAVFLSCFNAADRARLIRKLTDSRHPVIVGNVQDRLIEVTDCYDVRWILSL